MSLKTQREAARSGSLICPVCEKRRLLVEHHIHGRNHPDKNRKWNRCYICASCHDDIHAGNVILEGWVLTSQGKRLIWRRSGEAPVANEGASPNLYKGSVS